MGGNVLHERISKQVTYACIYTSHTYLCLQKLRMHMCVYAHIHVWIAQVVVGFTMYKSSHAHVCVCDTCVESSYMCVCDLFLQGKTRVQGGEVS